MRTLTAKEYQALKDADTLRIGEDVEDVEDTQPTPPKPYRTIYNYWIGRKTYFFLDRVSVERWSSSDFAATFLLLLVFYTITDTIQPRYRIS